MTHDLMYQKVMAESEVSRRGISHYGVYRFVITETMDQKFTEDFMKCQGYTKTEITLAKTAYARTINRDQNRKSSLAGMAF